MSERPSDKEAGVTTAPVLSEHDELLELRREVARLRRLLEPGVEENDSWPETIPYGEQPMSGARLMGITRERERIRPSSDFPELPAPTADQAQLEADFMRWGYCVVADAMDQAQIALQTERLLDQAEAEKAAGIAHLSYHGSGRQELHQDQGFVPLPHPSYPLYCLIIWTYSEFNLEAGGTYIVPGSHRDAAGHNLVRPDTAYEELADERIVSLCALLGFKPYYGLGMVDGNAIDPAIAKVPIGELSMSRPDELEQDFDWRYSADARQLAERDWDEWVDYRGPLES